MNLEGVPSVVSYLHSSSGQCGQPLRMNDGGEVGKVGGGEGGYPVREGGRKGRREGVRS